MGGGDLRSETLGCTKHETAITVQKISEPASATKRDTPLNMLSWVAGDSSSRTVWIGRFTMAAELTCGSNGWLACMMADTHE